MKLHHSKTFAGSAALLIGAAVLLSGCSSSTPTTTSPSATTAPSSMAPSSMAPSSPVAGTPDLKTAESAKGTIVVDGKGMSLYFFTKDTKDTKVSACTGECLAAWPIAVASSETPVIEGVTGKVGTITSPDGKLQLTLNGMPLYYFAQDTKPGDILGQDVKEVWYLAAPDGSMIE
ncbi:COG4315 family predicted lipoprotein [Paeniglutamicibacter kerguelensis]|uniref:Lipoprotein with Yx(FWY)xxD motif n=1 Tax=Paeniglutamicibacter kerguelensis TaxID=254788 RepID=A0ABS4X8Y7_9MICC|nr:hypothetical protein [Paeniglutamicibacter kerguelensis]MBP2384811.1 putative lipoprotein with Yx(FWY)xxD motif [Paeniglutamicibacter kerguelensis]